MPAAAMAGAGFTRTNARDGLPARHQIVIPARTMALGRDDILFGQPPTISGAALKASREK
jgi:hypothetical protein